MNKKVWDDDKTMMYFINTTASKILSLADGKKIFGELVTEAFVWSKIDLINDETLESFHLKTELNDRFLQSTTFCISMWEREIVKFKISKTNKENVTISPLIQSALESDGDLTAKNAYSFIAKEDAENQYQIYNRFKANLAMLLAHDMLFVEFIGTMEDTDENIVADTDLPAYKIGYVKPELSVNLAGVQTRSPLVGAALGVAIGKVIDSAPEIGTSAGRIVGEMESR